MAQTAYRTWDSLKMKLQRLGKIHAVCSKSYSALATILLDTALKNGGYLPKEAYYSSPFEQPGLTYKEWIAQLKRAGLLAPFKDEDQSVEKSDWIRFKPGPITLPYVNKEKAHQNEMVSMRDLHDGMQSVEDRIDNKKADRVELEETKMKLEFTTCELKSTKEELLKTNQVVMKIAKAVRKLQVAKEPPITDEKLAIQQQAEKELEEHTNGFAN